MRAAGIPPEVQRGNRKQSMDCTEKPRAASSHRTLVEIVAGLAGTPHPDRRRWRNRPPRGRRRPVAEPSFFPSIISACSSKRTQMMAPVKTENTVFPRENGYSMSKGGQIKDVFYQTNPNDSAPHIGVSSVTTNAEPSFFPSIISACFSKRTQMMAPAKTGNIVFPRKNGYSMSKGGQIKDVFYQTNPNDSVPPIGVLPVTASPAATFPPPYVGGYEACEVSEPGLNSGVDEAARGW